MRSCFVTTLVPVSSHGLEIISLTVSNGMGKVCISIFYRPPSSPTLIFEDLFLYLQSLNIPEFCNCSEGGVLAFFSDASSVSKDCLLVSTSLEVLIPILFVGLGPNIFC